MSSVIVQSGQEVIGVKSIAGPIMIVEGAVNVSYDEVVEIRDAQGRRRLGRVLEVGEHMSVVQVFAGSTGLSIDGTRVRYLGDTLRIPVAEEMLGRVFDGLGGFRIGNGNGEGQSFSQVDLVEEQGDGLGCGQSQTLQYFFGLAL